MIRAFLSWARPDRAAAERLKTRLEASGVDCFLSSEDIPAGVDWRAEVQRAIASCDCGIVLLSDAAFVHSDWVKIELGALFGAGKPIIPLAVGSCQQRPDVIAPIQIQDFTSQELYEANVEMLVSSMFQQLGKNQPTRFYCALFAMTRSQFNACVGTPKWAAIERAFGAFRIVGDDVAQCVADRYQDTIEAFQPFEPGRALTDIVVEEVRAINAVREAANQPPIHLRWSHREFIARDRSFRPKWQSENSLLIVDSLSTCHPEVLQWVESVPHTEGAFLWLPPYTGQIAALEECVKRIVENSFHVSDIYEAARGMVFPPGGRAAKRWATFDLANKGAFVDWIYRVLRDRSAGPDPSLRDSMSQGNLYRDVPRIFS